MEEIYFHADIHNHVDSAQRFLDRFKPNKVIWLGDFFDSFGDSALEASKTAIWLNETIESRPQDIFLNSNHDNSYACPNCPQYQAWGFTKEKSEAINRILGNLLWDKQVLVHKETLGGRTIYFSHAGLHPKIFPFEQFNEEFLNRAVGHAMKERGLAGRNPLIDDVFGPLWTRWPLPLLDINQIVGHSPHKSIAGRLSKDLRYFNLCCDCAHTYAGKWTERGIFELNKNTGEEKCLIEFDGDRNIVKAT